MCELLLNKLRDVRDVSEMLNQTHGQPKQIIENVDVPAIIIDLGKDDEEEDGKNEENE